MHELKALQSENSEDVVLRCMSDSGLLDWRASIRGPPDTPFADIYYELIITVPSAYPLQPPIVSFATKVFHPNVHFKVHS
jgi:peroxin-4